MQQVLIAALNYLAFFGLLASVVLMYRRYAADIGHSGSKWPVIGGGIYVFASFLVGLIITILNNVNDKGTGGFVLDDNGSLVNELAYISALTFLNIAANILAAGFAYFIAPRVLRASVQESEVAIMRSRGLQVVLVLMSVFGVLGIVSNLTMNAETIASQIDVGVNAQWFQSVLGAQVAVGSASLIGLLALWRWRRWGLYVLIVCGIAAALANLAVLPWPLALLGLLGTFLIVYLVSRQWSEFS